MGEPNPADDAALWRILSERSSLFVARVDPQGIILEANAFARTMTGRDLAGEPVMALFLDFSQTLHWPEWVAAHDGPRKVSVPTALGLPETLSFSLLGDAHHVLLVGESDPAEEQHLRKEVLELNRDLSNLTRRQALANAELGRLNVLANQFLGMATHDLRRPAGLVLAYAEQLLEHDGLLVAEHRECLEIIRKAAKTMGQVIDDFLDHAVVESGRLLLDETRVDLRQCLAGALALLRPLSASRGLQVDVDIADDANDIMADAQKIERVLTNLLSNAIEHSPRAGVVRVSARRTEAGLRLSVLNSGEGVPPGVAARLFRPFSGTRRRRDDGERSFGLGLTIAQTIVEAHGGAMFVESEAGRGATFGFTLPWRAS